MPDAPTPDPDGVPITINGVSVSARPGELVIDACERNGAYIPRFCYHPRMEPVGMCRMCLVEIDSGRGPALQPSCMIPVAPNMSVDTTSEVTKKAQDGILEFLLINHPLDCPVCDKGGECPLQDQTLSYGPGESRFIEEKRHHEKPIPISDLVLLDRERCILCDRCTRFAKDVAGDTLIHFQERGGQTEVNTFPEHPFASYFSGNTVQICPVGALTAEPYRFKARPWDLDVVESTCTSCSVGCRVTIEASRNRVLRVNGVDIDPVNWGWLCDKGRFGFQAVEHPDRLAEPLAKDASGQLAPTTWSAALEAAAEAIDRGLDRSGPSGLAVLGGARLTNEAAYAWVKLVKGELGSDNVDAQLGDGLAASTVLGLPRASIDDVCAAGGTVLYLGPDPKEELPVLFLRLRHAARNDKVRIIEVAPQDTSLTALATHSFRYVPGTAAEVVAQLVDPATEPVGLDAAAKRAAAELLGAGPVTVVLGRPSVAESAATIEAAAGVLLAHLDGVRFLPALRRGNVAGALDAGMAPGLLPGRTALAEAPDHFVAAWDAPDLPTEAGLDAAGILTAAAEGRIDTLVLLGADPLSDFPDHGLAARGLAGARTVIAVDTFLNPSAAKADVVLAAAGWGEVAGTTTNLEGRVSNLGRKVTAPGTARADWMIAAELALRLGDGIGLESSEAISAEQLALGPAYAGVTPELLVTRGGLDGVLVPLPGSAPEAVTPDEPPAAAEATVPVGAGGDATATEEALAAEADVSLAEAETTELPVGPPSVIGVPSGLEAPRVPPVDSYSLRLIASRKLYDQGTLVQHAPSLAGLAAASVLRINPYDFERLGVAEGGRLKITAPRGSLTAAVVSDRGVPRGAAALVGNVDGTDPGDLIDAGAAVTDIRVETT